MKNKILHFCYTNGFDLELAFSAYNKKGMWIITLREDGLKHNASNEIFCQEFENDEDFSFAKLWKFIDKKIKAYSKLKNLEYK